MKSLSSTMSYLCDEKGNILGNTPYLPGHPKDSIAGV